VRTIIDFVHAVRRDLTNGVACGKSREYGSLPSSPVGTLTESPSHLCNSVHSGSEWDARARAQGALRQDLVGGPENGVQQPDRAAARSHAKQGNLAVDEPDWRLAIRRNLEEARALRVPAARYDYAVNRLLPISYRVVNGEAEPTGSHGATRQRSLEWNPQGISVTPFLRVESLPPSAPFATRMWNSRFDVVRLGGSREEFTLRARSAAAVHHAAPRLTSGIPFTPHRSQGSGIGPGKTGVRNTEGR
jgi:hypothetical protein